MKTFNYKSPAAYRKFPETFKALRAKDGSSIDWSYVINSVFFSATLAKGEACYNPNSLRFLPALLEHLKSESDADKNIEKTLQESIGANLVDSIAGRINEAAVQTMLMLCSYLWPNIIDNTSKDQTKFVSPAQQGELCKLREYLVASSEPMETKHEFGLLKETKKDDSDAASSFSALLQDLEKKSPEEVKPYWQFQKLLLAIKNGEQPKELQTLIDLLYKKISPSLINISSIFSKEPYAKKIDRIWGVFDPSDCFMKLKICLYGSLVSEVPTNLERDSTRPLLYNKGSSPSGR